MSRRSSNNRHGLTLLEMLALLTLLGVFLAVASSRMGYAALGNLGSRTDARRLALDLAQAQRRAVATGDNHYVELTWNGSRYTGYTLYRRSGGSSTAVEAARIFPTSLTVTATHSVLEYTFEASALAAYQVTLAGSAQTWQVTVVPATGAVRVVKI